MVTRREGRRAALAVVAAVMVLGAGCSSQPSLRVHATSARPGLASPAAPSHPAGVAATGATSGDPSAASRVAPDVPATATCPATGLNITSASQLSSALAAAQPGQVLLLAPGTYAGNFTAHVSGTAQAPVTLCGPRSAVLHGSGIDHGYVFHLDHASWWRVVGFTVENGQKGVVADGVTDDLIDGLYVHDVGDEAIHLRSASSDNTVSNCVVRRTGLHDPMFGEGIYVGSAHKNWCAYSGCGPDASDRNVLQGNDIDDTTAENIDIKEGTTGGQILGNQLDGVGMVASAASAWVNVKGNRWSVVGNTGVDSLRDGFQVHQVYSGWGLDNVFRSNAAAVNGPGYGIYVQNRRLGTVVLCDNTVTGAGSGLSNMSCTTTVPAGSP